MSFIVIIPARYSSSRLPGKPLVDIGGKPMIQRVYELAEKSKADEVYIATDHNDIIDCCSSFGAKALIQKDDELVCYESGLAYPIRDGIPIMLPEEARKLKKDEIKE